jgi:hypothetical protein
MVETLDEVHNAFFSLFGEKVLITANGQLVNVPVRYARKSSFNHAEGDIEAYPQIAIQDYAPEDERDKWSVSGESTYENEVDIDDDGIVDVVDVVGDPQLLTFRYDVMQATRDFLQGSALYTWFIKNYPRWWYIEINGVRYTMSRESRDVYRTDGIHEFNHEFKIEVWFKGHVTEAVPVLQDVQITMHQLDTRITIPPVVLPPAPPVVDVEDTTYKGATYDNFSYV